DAVTAKLRSLDVEETEVRAALDATASDLSEADAEIASVSDSRTEHRSIAAASMERLQHIRDELASIDASSRASEQAEIAARAEAHAAAERLERARSDAARLVDQASVISREIEELDSSEGRAGLTVGRLETERNAANTSLADADASLRRVESEKAVLEGRAESLRVAAELGARRREGADALRRTHGDAYAARGILGELITVPSGLERAAEVALGDALDALVVAGASAADAVERAEADELDV